MVYGETFIFDFQRQEFQFQHEDRHSVFSEHDPDPPPARGVPPPHQDPGAGKSPRSISVQPMVITKPAWCFILVCYWFALTDLSLHYLVVKLL